MVSINVEVYGSGSNITEEFDTEKLFVNGQVLYFEDSQGNTTGMYVVPEGAYVTFKDSKL